MSFPYAGILLTIYYLVLGSLAFYGLHRLFLVIVYLRTRRRLPPLTPQSLFNSLPRTERVERAPGAGLQRLAQLWFSKKVYGRVFESILSDLQVEYFDALQERDRLKARFVLVRGYGAFWLAVVAQLLSFLRVVLDLWKATKIG